MENAHKKIELYCMLTDIVKSLKFKAETKKEINSLDRIESNLFKLMSAVIVKD